MSPSSVELLIRGFTGWGKTLPPACEDILQPNCEPIVPDSVPYGGTLSDGKLVRGRVYADTAVLRETVEGVTPT